MMPLNFEDGSDMRTRNQDSFVFLARAQPRIEARIIQPRRSHKLQRSRSLHFARFAPLRSGWQSFYYRVRTQHNCDHATKNTVLPSTGDSCQWLRPESKPGFPDTTG